MKYEISYKINVYKQDPKDPEKSILVAKNRPIKSYINLTDVTSVTQHYTVRGKVSKTKCEITHNELGSIIIETPYDVMCELVQIKPIKIKGYGQN